MNLVDFILNLAGLLLWLNWRAIHLSSVTPPQTARLLGTLKRAEPPRGRRWRYLAGLALLLFVRAIVYRQIGAALRWTPHLHLGVIALPFRSDAPGRMLLFSLLSFSSVLGVFYLWLLVLSVVNRNEPDTDPLQKLVRLHLGWMERLPALIRLLLPPLAAALLWCSLSPLFTRLGTQPAPHSFAHTVQQALTLGLATFPAWKYLILAILMVHLLNTYVYLGTLVLWNFVNSTARHVLAPFSWLPLRLGKLDLAPAAAMVLVWLAADFGQRWLTDLYRRLPL